MAKSVKKRVSNLEYSLFYYNSLETLGGKATHSVVRFVDDGLCFKVPSRFQGIIQKQLRSENG